MRVNLDAEFAVIGAIFLGTNPLSIDLVADELSEVRLRELFVATLALASRYQPIDEVTVANELAATGKTQLAGGSAFMASLTERVPSAVNVGHYAGLVREAARHRQLESLVQGWGERVTGAGGVDEMIEMIQTQALGMTAARRGSVGMREGLVAFQRHLQERETNPPGMSWGFRSVDAVAVAIEPTKLYIVAGRPAMGKTLYVLEVARRALRKKKSVLVISLEMGRNEIYSRLAAAEGNVPSRMLTRGGFNRAGWDSLTDVMQVMADWDLRIADDDVVSLPRITSEITAQQARGKLDLVIVDYLQLINAIADSREQEISKISRGLKILAKSLGVPIMAVSQLNRAVEGRDNKRPQLSDLRESGSIEQDSDVVMMLYRDGYYNADSSTPNMCEVGVMKQRNGPTGTARIQWEPEFSRMGDL